MINWEKVDPSLVRKRIVRETIGIPGFPDTSSPSHIGIRGSKLTIGFNH